MSGDREALSLKGKDERASAGERFHRFSVLSAQVVGNPWAFAAAAVSIVVWAACGPMFDYSQTWQLVINTSTTIITFMMVFVIQSTQNRDSRAVHLKLDELIRASAARNVFADLEDASEAELDAFQREFAKLREDGKSGSTAMVVAHRRLRERKHRRKR